MPYDMYEREMIMRAKVSLDTRRALDAGRELGYNLNKVLSNNTLKINSDSIIQANKDVIMLQQNLQAALNPTRGTIDLAMFDTQLQKSEKSLIDYAKSLSKYGRDGADAYISLTKAISSAEAPTTRLNQRVKDAGEQLKRTIGWQVSSSTIHGVMSTYSQAINYAKQLNRSLTDIRIVTGQSQAQMANFAKYANVAAKNLSSTTTRYTDAALIYYQQGLSDKAVKERTDVTVKMANVAGVSAEKASQQLTAIWNNFDNGTKSLEHYADVLVKLGSETASSSNEISKGVQKFAAIGNTVGLSYEYAASALATVTATTRESADAVGTSFRTLFSRLQGLSLGETLEDGTTLNKYSKALNTIGVRIKETNGDMRSMNDILDDIGSKWSSLNKDTQIGLAQSIGGARQYSTFMALMDNWDYFQQNVQRANNAAGALEEQQKIYAESWDAASKRVQSSMEKIFDSVINDKAIIGMTNVFSGALDGLNGLINGFGGLGGIMSSVSGIFMTRYAKEMPRVMQELKYNYDYMLNGKQGTISAKQNRIFEDAEKGIVEIADANQLNMVNGVYDTTGDNAVLAQQLNNAKSSMERRKQYLAVEKTLSQQEKEAYQGKLAIFDMWDSNVVAQAQSVQDQTEILKAERKSAATANYDQLRRSAEQQRKKAKDQITAQQKEYQDYQARNQIDGYDLTTKEGREKYAKTISKDAMALYNKHTNNPQENSESVLRTLFNMPEGQKILNIKQAEADGERFKTSPVNLLNDQQRQFIQDNQDKFGTTTIDDFYAGIQNLEQGNNILHTQRMAIESVFTGFQEPVVQAATGIGAVNESLKKFDHSLSSLGTDTAKISDDMKKSLGKDLKSSISSVEREYKEQLKTIGEFNEETKTFTLKDSYAKAEGGAELQSNINSTLKMLQEKGALFNDDGTFKGTPEDFKKFTEDMKKASGAILNATDKQSPIEVDRDVVTEALEKGSKEFKLRESAGQRKKEFDEAEIKHQVAQSEKIMQAASAMAMTASTLQASHSAYQTLTNKNATGFEKTMSVVGAATSGMLMHGNLKQLGTTLGGDSTLGKLLMGSGAGWLSLAATVGPAAYQLIADHTETKKEREARISQDAINAQQRAEQAVQNQSVFEKSLDNYQSNIEKAYLSQEGTYEQRKAINQSNVDTMAMIDKYNLQYGEDYTRNEKGLIEIKNETLNNLQNQINDEVSATLNRSFGANAIDSLNKIQTKEELLKEAVIAKYGLDVTQGEYAQYSSYEDAYRASGATQADFDKIDQRIENQQFMAESNYVSALQGIAGAEGQISESEQNAINMLSQNYSEEEQKAVADRIEKLYGGDASTWALFGGKTDAQVKQNALKILGEEQYQQILDSEEYRALEDDTAKKQYIMDVTKQEALAQEYGWQIQQTEKSVGRLSAEYKNISNVSMQTLKTMAEDTSKTSNEDILGQQYIAAQANKAVSDLEKAVGKYTDQNISDIRDIVFDNGFTLDQTTTLAETMQNFGDTFGEDAAKSIYNATIEASEKDRRILLSNLKEIDFSGSNINTLNQIYDLSEDLGGKFTKVFEDVKKSFGGDAGIFKEIVNDKSIQKLMSKFEQLGDIDAESIVKATHSSDDLAMAMDIAGFNAGGLAAALEGVASGTIKEEQVTNSLLAGLSTLNQIDSIRAEAYDSIDTYDKGRSVTEYGKFTGNLAKTIQYNLRNGYMFDETLQNAWGELFGEDRVYELQQDFINWQSADKRDISKNFNRKYKDEIEFLKAVKKNPYDLSTQWKYAFKRSDVDVDEHYNDVWVGSNDTEKDKDTDHISYNTVGEEEYRNAWNILYNKEYQLNRDLNGDSITALEQSVAENVIAQAKKEQAIKDKYVNINGAIYEVGTGEGQVQWKDGKWVSLDGEGKEVKPNVDNALFGWNSRTNQVSFNEGFMKSDMTLDDMRDYLAIGMGMGEDSANRMIADLMAQNTTMQKKFGDSQADKAISEMTKAALKNDEWITQDQMDVMFQSSNYLKNKYEAGKTEGWMADYLSGKDIKEVDITKYQNEDGTWKNDKAQEDYEKAQAAYEATKAQRADFQKRYISFGQTDLRTATFEEADAALKKATGMGTINRLQSNKVKVDGQVYTSGGQYVDAQFTKDGYDLSDTMQQLLAMGYSQTQAYEAMTKIMDDGNKVLVESIRDVNGNVQTFSSDSKAYQQWSEQHGIEETEQNAESFNNFIKEQDAVAKAVQQMAVEAQAKAQYEAMYNADGTRKIDEKTGKPVEAEDKGDTEVTKDEDEIEDAGGDESAATEAEEPPPPPASDSGGGGDNGGGSTGGKTQGKSQNNTQSKNEASWLIGLGAYKDTSDGKWKIDFKPPRNEGERQEQISANAALDRVNNANAEKDLAADLAGSRAVGQNQNKIKKKYAKGRKRTEPYEGLAQVGEVGPELSIDKDGNMTMLGTNGPTYAYVEKDDIIFTADETKDILKTTPNLNNIPGFEWGIGGSSNIESSAYGKDNIWNGYGNSSGGSGGGSSGGSEEEWEPDRYVVILEQLQDLQREYSRLVKAKERAFGADKIKAIDAEIAKTNELVKAQKAYISEIEQYKTKDLQKLKDLGIDVDKEFQMDRNGVIRNFDEISEKYKKAAEEGNRGAAKQYEAIMKFMETNNLLQEQTDALIDMQWQLMDAQIERITTKVDIKVAVDDTDLQYLSYQLGKINEEAYDVAKALNIVGDSIEANLNKINAYRQGLGETLQEAFDEIGLDENAQKELLNKIEQGTLTQEDLDNFKISPDHSQNIMNVLLDYRQQLITVNQQLDQLRDQVTSLVVRHFTDFTKDVGEQTSLINTYTSTLQTYANLTELLNGRFQGNMDKILTDINSSISKNAKDSIKNTELLVQAAELKYAELNEMYVAAQKIGDQATMDKVADARDKAYKELQEANNNYASAWMSANEAFLNEFKFGINQAIENFQEQLSPLFGTIDQLSAAFDRQNGLNDQYVDDYEKYYELNKMNRDLQSAIDETDNVNIKKALMKMQEEINKEKANENKLSEYDLKVLKNKVELEKARLALDEAKNAKSIVTLSRDQNGNWGYIYTAEEDKVAQAEQTYEDKLYEYQKANKEYLDDLQAMVVEAQSNMVSALAELDVNDPHYEEQRKSIIDSYMQTVAYVKEQMQSALGNQEDSRLVALERYDISMINLKNDFKDLSLSFITGEKNLENYFATLETSMPTLLDQLNELENKYESNIADINNYVTSNKNIADYMNENMDTLVNKSGEANQKIQGLYNTMVDELADVNKEVADIYNNWLPHIMEMTEKNEILAESISKIQHELSDLSEVEVPPVLKGESWEHPEGYTENDYGVIRKLTEDEIKLREEIAKEIEKDDKGVITNYDKLKEMWYEEPPKEGEEDKRDADKKAKWELLQKLIGYGVYGDPNAKQTIGLTGVWETIQSNAEAMYNAAVAVAQGFSGTKLMVEQNVTISAEFPNVTNSSEIEDAFNNLINEAAQYANRK